MYKIIIVSLLFFIYAHTAEKNDVHLKTFFNSYDQAVKTLCCSPLGLAPTTIVLLQKMPQEKKDEIIAISKGENQNPIISKAHAAIILSRMQEYNDVLEFYEKNIGCFSQFTNNNQ